MVLHFQLSLPQALELIDVDKNIQFPIQIQLEKRTIHNSNILLSKYGEIKWKIVDSLNQKYSALLPSPFDLYNWLNKNTKDEVAYFLNEAGSNALSYAQHQIPSQFHLYLGKKGFIIAIEQQGQSFNPIEIDEKNIKENEGAGFTFFRNSKSTIFFDNPLQASIIYFLYLLPR
ncbi:TPA: hypothetical protein HA242_06575 [Candidatus Woesearchaeota archaeon]|nr:hypothetical protein [Candidatus Woesearchaeota archaeon]HIG93070.1 hypothetical protein [Candidatus Woesearchaeota archaeon]HIH13360.1 hypothetical protein [Candidatus Woesearchaeota archaeon]